MFKHLHQSCWKWEQKVKVEGNANYLEASWSIYINNFNVNIRDLLIYVEDCKSKEML